MICFVIMGYGCKTDYRNGRVLDLDKTYVNIIKPVVESFEGMKCIRADEIPRSGVIDVEMYRLLLRADIVIADLSTYNCNAIYELGVRHALKPKTTIVISENELDYPFDLNHVVISKYEHLCSDIGYSEVLRFKEQLQSQIQAILDNPQVDSPVYTYLCSLEPPSIREETTTQNESTHAALGDYIKKANQAVSEDDFIEAIVQLKIAIEFDPNNSYLKQRLALATYKSKVPDGKSALLNALEILKSLDPDRTTDPETLGLLGAVYKRLWELDCDPLLLESAIGFCNRGFLIKRDYYNGINLAYLHNVKASIQTGNERIADIVIANRIRKDVIAICEGILKSNTFCENEKYWIYATLEEAFTALGEPTDAKKYKELALSCDPDDWQRQTTQNQIEKLIKLLDTEE